ncbi:MAG: BREX-1 system adenine-specific DNA-methyltransferase PglX [Gemmatales bacterium]|nr:BREX-1 system adenine-specific DNA-methyltransferase PglX [Gemmatales bacterium]MDW7993067.1 BREX-1 system adenine-specific DNA-methyltransferase PglX [Gemmatales bacterium]
MRQLLRRLALDARARLERAVAELLEGQYDLYEKSGQLVADPNAPLRHLDDEGRSLRAALLKHFDDLQRCGLTPRQAYRQFLRETAFTWLNRLVAFKMLEARRWLRETISRWDHSNGYLLWLADHRDAWLQHQRGGESRDAAYLRFLLDCCRQLAREIRVLFDPDNLASRFAPPLAVLREVAHALNQPQLAEAWQPGNEETLGWVYQFFVEEEKAHIFEQLYKHKRKISAEDLPAATQIFTPRWMVRFLVHNTLGRLWLQLHPDSNLRSKLDYLLPEALTPAELKRPIRSVREIKLLDPACGTMHFGLVAFDLFVEMYQEEMARAGQPGWPAQPPVDHPEDIPAAILEQNLHGIDIDLRAVQIAALALYLKAKTLAPGRTLRESRLACANVHMLDGERLATFLRQAGLGERPIYQRILTALQEELQRSQYLGSLLPLERRIRALVEEERQRYERAGRNPDLFGWSREQFGSEAARRHFWDTLLAQIRHALDQLARDQDARGIPQTFFAGETVQGLRLLQLLDQTYDVVVTNPPYSTAWNLDPVIKDLLAKHYPEGKTDIYAAFLLRGSQLLSDGGRLGMVTQQSFMFISSYERLRQQLLQEHVIETLAHLGTEAFEEIAGAKVNTALLVLRKESDERRRAEAVATYFRLVKEPDAPSKRQRLERALAALRQAFQAATSGASAPPTSEASALDPAVFRYRQADFDAIPGSPWVYWITPGLRRLFQTLPKLGDVAAVRPGLTTADNFRFVRFWWEVGKERIAFD